MVDGVGCEDRGLVPEVYFCLYWNKNDRNISVLVEVSIAVKKNPDYGNSYKEKLLIELAVQFRGSVHHHGSECGGMQAVMVLTTPL